VSAVTTFPTLEALQPLTFQRLRQQLPTMEFSLDHTTQAGSLGGRWVGRAPQALSAPLLAFDRDSDGAIFDSWLSHASTQVHQHGCVHYTTDGHWLHGYAEIDDAAHGMHVAAQRLYADVFQVLSISGCPYFLRLWNYFSDMNLEVDGLERYRQFNAGRQQAFLDAQYQAFEGSPAACALGTRSGPLRVYFLAGRTPPQVIENPRQVSAYHYPDQYGPRSPSFSRAALVSVGAGQLALFISGTASILGHATVHVGDVRRQTEESLLNIAAVRGVAALRAGTLFQADALIYTLYLRHADDLEAVRKVFEQAVGSQTTAAREAIYLQADVCRPDLLVEIEAHGFVTGSLPAIRSVA
jgi:chorismate lyase / 3-hydroxybenzoate synthase